MKMSECLSQERLRGKEKKKAPPLTYFLYHTMVEYKILTLEKEEFYWEVLLKRELIIWYWRGGGFISFVYRDSSHGSSVCAFVSVLLFHPSETSGYVVWAPDTVMDGSELHRPPALISLLPRGLETSPLSSYSHSVKHNPGSCWASSVEINTQLWASS